jgi:hypothetical protein
MMPAMPRPTEKPSAPAALRESRNRANTRKNWSKVEDYLIGVEKDRGFAKAWELRERLERGEVTLDDLTRR